LAASEHSYSAFLRDRAGGYEAEQWLVNFLTAQGLTDVRRYDDTNLTYDVSAVKNGETLRYEVKRDKRAYDSYNAIYVEAYNGFKASGVQTTTADWWVHLIGDAAHPGEALFFRPAELLRLALEHNRLIACGNGPSHVFKVPTAIARQRASKIVQHGLA
jgi:hypothetical protein